MNNYEKLLDTAEKNGITVTEKFDLSGTRFKGLYCDGVIVINQDIETNSERTEILAEELGHYHTTYGNILDLNNTENQKQELRARLWAYNKIIGLQGIVNAYKHGCSTLHDMADFLDVTEDFLSEALERYRSKYGRCTALGNFIICFEPFIRVFELK